MRLYRSQRFIRPDLQCHIYSNALLENVRNLKSLCAPETKFCAVVKANAYGHGIEESVNVLKNAGIDFFAVSSIYEAIHIDSIIDDQSIFILEAINSLQGPDQISLCAKKAFHCSVSSLKALDHITEVLKGTSDVINLHVNIETGMGRCGLSTEEAMTIVKEIDKRPNTRLAGVYTHFATADEEDLTYAYKQLDNFNAFLDAANLRNRNDLIIHAANSAATIKIPNAHFDMVRCGISMYGYYSRFMPNAPIPLKPVMKLKAPIARLKTIPKGQSVSYGCSFVTQRETTAAIIPLGYADGYWRGFSNKAKMKIKDRYVPVIGRVCMDQLLLDVTDIPNVSVGQFVTVIDNDHSSKCGGYGLAELADTICYEILICVHAHVNRILH